MRSLGPIGHLSADLRRWLAIQDDQAILGVVKVTRRKRDDEKEKRQSASGRFLLAPDFAIPGPFSDRPMSASGHVSFHLSRDIVTKGPGGSSILHAASGPKRLSSSAPADHDSYVARPDAVMALTAADFEVYAGRESAVELAGDGTVALLTNISSDPAVRRDYWRKVHEHEREAQPDVLEFHRSRLPTSSWLQIAANERLPSHVREMAAAMAAARGRKGNAKKPDAEVEMDRGEAGRLLAVIRDEIGDWDWRKSPIRVRKGRGGRTQFRLTAEFPIGIDAAARLRITSAFCRDLDAIGAMYTAAIHAPDFHNDDRNFHLHIAYHDRPASLMPDGRWDFEVREKVQGQWNRFRYPYRQPKIAELSRDPEGGNSRIYAASQMHRMREQFAKLCNCELNVIGNGRLFDPRTFAEMGIDQPPTTPLGPRCAALEAVGFPTAAGINNSEIIWTAELQRNITTCNDARKTRDTFRARVGDALQSLAEVGDHDLSSRIQALAVSFDRHAEFLATHEMEIGELGITLAMAHARPTKTADTCSQLLRAIDNGKASAADVKNRALIDARLRDAESFLDRIDAISEGHKAILEPLLDQRDVAINELVVITANLERLLAEELATALVRTPPVKVVPPVVEDRPPVRSDRELIDDLLDRITKEDQPILLTDDGNYRVPGISRDEFRLLNADHFSRWVQTRLARIAEIQDERMKQAARLLRKHGPDGLSRMAATDSNVRRALKHLAAYKEHPTMMALTTVPIRSAGATGSIHDLPSDAGSAAVSTSKNAPAEPRAQLPTVESKERSTTNLPNLVPVVVEAENKFATPVIDRSSITREAAIATYADVIRQDPGVRLFNRDGEIHVDPKSVPEWSTSAQVFSDEEEVRDAIRDRLEIERERGRSLTRGRIIGALERCAVRPVERIGGRWHITNLREDLLEIAHQWQDHPELSVTYSRLNERWTAKEILAAQEPAKQVSGARRDEEPNRADAEQALDPSGELQRGYLDFRSGRGR